MLVFMCRKILEIITGDSSSPLKGHHLLELRLTGRMSAFLCVSMSCLNSDLLAYFWMAHLCSLWDIAKKLLQAKQKFKC